MNKKTVILLALLLILGIVGFKMYQQNAQMSTGASNSRQFKVEDISNVDRIFVADKNASIIDLNKKNGKWYLKDGIEADQFFVDYLLKTINKIEVINLVPKAAIPRVMNEIGALGLKVEIYDGKKLVKSYYVGMGNPTGETTYMVLNGFNIPYEVSIPGFDGDLRSRYWPLSQTDLISRVLAEYPINSIRKVSVDYPRNKSESFILTVKGSKSYDLEPFYSTTTKIESPVKPGEVEAFLAGFEKMYGAKAFTKNEMSSDTMISEIPFLNLQITGSDDVVRKLIMYPVINTEQEGQRVDLEHRPFNFFVTLDDRLFFYAQEDQLKKIFFGYSFFFK